VIAEQLHEGYDEWDSGLAFVDAEQASKVKVKVKMEVKVTTTMKLSSATCSASAAESIFSYPTMPPFCRLPGHR